MPSQRLKYYLDQHHADYQVIPHEMAFTAIDIARSAHIPSKQMAKTVIVRIKGAPAMVVVPAAYQVKLPLLQEVFDTRDVELVEETQLSHLFPDCEVGAMPPFGNLYLIPVYVAESLSNQEEIVFNAGSHGELIKMTYKGFEALVQPKLVILQN